MKIEKRVNLYAFEVEYIDQREAKPRTVRRETVVLDGGRVSALERLGQSPASWICQQYARQGFTVGAVHKGEHLTANATVDTDFLWKLAVLDVAAAKAGKAVAQLLEGGVNHAQA
mgnify:CR=1 FL=1